MMKLIRNAFPGTMYLIVRTDLKMGKGKIASQCSHAAVLCKASGFQASQRRNGSLLKNWMLCGQPKIVLKVDNLEELEKLGKQAEELGIVAEVVRDAGRTQIPEATVTVLGLGPEGKELESLVKHLKLL
ncbi:peptidyl-tRNA hydrolase 2, mitochondrial [Bradysia coprophila]|uniref:peptidyl-tRNA hydrolase 2, mitochondrial n=1 Tax=Bradysia coprophila TaxID=38358 RepID=UPI00187D897B|nr:peptidyl-tRNA hydrolase 2, mitochondrial [Bradysia coprophila]